MIENGAVERFLRGEMAKHHRLGNTSGQGDFLRRRPPKSALREQSHGDAQNLQPALFAGHATSIRTGTDFFLRLQAGTPLK